MNRILRTTSSGLFAASIAILPLTAFAQGGSASDAKTHANTPATTQSTTAPAAGTQAKAGTTVSSPAKDGVKTDGAKSSANMPANGTGAKVSVAPAAPAGGSTSTPAKTGG